MRQAWRKNIPNRTSTDGRMYWSGGAVALVCGVSSPFGGPVVVIAVAHRAQPEIFSLDVAK